MEPSRSPAVAAAAAANEKRPKKKDTEQTLVECNLKLQRNPTDVALLLQRGHLILRKAETANGQETIRKELFAMALADFEHACRLSPGCVEALYHCGSAFEKQNRLEQAIELYSQVLQLQPHHARAALARGACLNIKGEIAQALEDYSLALAHDDGHCARQPKAPGRRRLVQEDEDCSASRGSDRHSPASSSSSEARGLQLGPSPSESAESMQGAGHAGGLVCLVAGSGPVEGVPGGFGAAVPHDAAPSGRSVQQQQQQQQPGASTAPRQRQPGSNLEHHDTATAKKLAALPLDRLSCKVEKKPGTARRAAHQGHSGSDTSAVRDTMQVDREGGSVKRLQQPAAGKVVSARHLSAVAHTAPSKERPASKVRPPALTNPAPAAVNNSIRSSSAGRETAAANVAASSTGRQALPAKAPVTAVWSAATGGAAGATTGAGGGALHRQLQVVCSPRAWCGGAMAEPRPLPPEAGVPGPGIDYASQQQPWPSASPDQLNGEAQPRTAAVEQCLAHAYTLRQQGDFSAAAREYRRALALEPERFKTLFNLGFTHDKLGEYDAAIEGYTRAIALEPRSSVAFFNRGITKERLGDLQGAINDFSTAIALDPVSADAFHNRGYAYRKAGMLEAAVADYSQAILLNPRHSRAFYNRGFTLEGLNLLDQALQDYTASIELEPLNVTALHSRGSLHQRLGRLPEALADFDAALACDGSHAVVHNARGVLLQGMGQLARAQADFDAAVRLAPGWAAFARNRGQCRRAMGDIHGSIADFTQAIQLDPSDVSAHVQRGHSFRRVKQFEAGIKDYSIAMQLSGARVNVSLYNHRAYSYAKIGCYAESVNDYNRVLELDPGNAHALSNRAFGLEKLGITTHF